MEPNTSKSVVFLRKTPRKPGLLLPSPYQCHSITYLGLNKTRSRKSLATAGGRLGGRSGAILARAVDSVRAARMVYRRSSSTLFCPWSAPPTLAPSSRRYDLSNERPAIRRSDGIRFLV